MRTPIRCRSVWMLIALIALLLEGCEVIFEEVIIFDQRDLIVGSYDIDEYSETDGLNFNYELEVYKSVHDYQSIIIYNLYDANTEIIAHVYNNGKKIRIPRQRVLDFEFEGIGTLYGSGELSLTYSVHDLNPRSNFVDFLSATGWKY